MTPPARVLALLAAAAALALAGCSAERGASAPRQAEAPAYRGADNPFVAGDWKPGDQKSWEQHMRDRAQYGQNEYSRGSGGS